jgi:hypothetical protein
MSDLHVYVAGPLTKGDWNGNIRAACQMADALFDHGFMPFVPHLTSTWDLISHRDYEDWMKLDFAWLQKCDAVFRLQGESPGADREVALAKELDIPVFTSVAAILEWRREEETREERRMEKCL